MICKQCETEGIQSIVHLGPVTQTVAHCPPFYDDKGMLHVHDINNYKQNYRCTKGHYWQESQTRKCPNCDWVHPNE